MVVRVGTYTRRSTDEDHQPFSIEAQDARLAAYIASQDEWWHVPDCTFTDDKSGFTLDRPDLQRALTFARAGRYDLLLVAKVDRLSRSIRGLTQILDDLETAGVSFRSATEPFDTATPAGRMMVQMLGVFAEFERRMIIDRVIAGMERKAASGQWTTGTHPPGYTVDPKSGFLVVRPDESPRVPIMFDLYGNKHLGARATATWLNDKGYRTRAGRPWTHTSVLAVLRNRVYIGEIFFRGRYYKAPHPPLVDRELFDRVQRLLAERGEDRAARAAHGYLATGKLRCGRCNRRYFGAAGTGAYYRYRYYICYSRQRYGVDACRADRLPADQLEQALLDALLTTLERGDLIERAAANLRGQLSSNAQRYEAELSTVDSELRRTDQALDRYMLAFEDGQLDTQRFGTRVEQLAMTSKKLQQRKDHLLAGLQQAQAQPPADHLLADLRDHVRQAIEDSDYGPKRALVDALVQDIEVRGRDEIYPTFRVPVADVDEESKVRMLSGLVGAVRVELTTFSVSALQPNPLLTISPPRQTRTHAGRSHCQKRPGRPKDPLDRRRGACPGANSRSFARGGPVLPDGPSRVGPLALPTRLLQGTSWAGRPRGPEATPVGEPAARSGATGPRRDEVTMMRDLPRIADLTPADLDLLLNEATAATREPHEQADLLRVDSVVLYFARPSTRSRLALQTAFARLGGVPLEIRPGALQRARSGGRAIGPRRRRAPGCHRRRAGQCEYRQASRNGSTSTRNT